MKNLLILPTYSSYEPLVREVCEKASQLKIKGFDMSLEKLEKILIFKSYEEIKAISNEYIVLPKETYKDALGSYVTQSRVIYLYLENLSKHPEVQIKLTLLHEIGHFLMESNGYYDDVQYTASPIYRNLEEMKVESFSLFLAKFFLKEEEMEYAKERVGEYLEFFRQMNRMLKISERGKMVSPKRGGRTYFTGSATLTITPTRTTTTTETFSIATTGWSISKEGVKYE